MGCKMTCNAWGIAVAQTRGYSTPNASNTFPGNPAPAPSPGYPEPRTPFLPPQSAPPQPSIRPSPRRRSPSCSLAPCCIPTARARRRSPAPAARHPSRPRKPLPESPTPILPARAACSPPEPDRFREPPPLAVAQLQRHDSAAVQSKIYVAIVGRAAPDDLTGRARGHAAPVGAFQTTAPLLSGSCAHTMPLFCPATRTRLPPGSSFRIGGAPKS